MGAIIAVRWSYGGERDGIMVANATVLWGQAATPARGAASVGRRLETASRP